MANPNQEVDNEWHAMLEDIDDADILHALIFHLVNLGFGGELRDMIDELEASSSELYHDIMQVLPNPGTREYYQYVQHGFSVPTGPKHAKILQLTVIPLDNPLALIECEEDVTSTNEDLPTRNDYPRETVNEFILKNNKLRETGLTILRFLLMYKKKYEELRCTSDERYYKLLNSKFDMRIRYNTQITKLRKIIQVNSELCRQENEAHLKTISQLELQLNERSNDIVGTYLDLINHSIDCQAELEKKYKDLNEMRVQLNQSKSTWSNEKNLYDERIETIKKVLVSREKLFLLKELEVNELNAMVEEMHSKHANDLLEQEICIDQQRQEIARLKNEIENINDKSSNGRIEEMFNDCLEERFALEKKFIELKQQKEEESIGIKKITIKARKQIRSFNKFITDCSETYKNINNFNDVKMLFKKQEEKIKALSLKIEGSIDEKLQLKANLTEEKGENTCEKLKLEQEKIFEQRIRSEENEKYKVLQAEIEKINSQLQDSNADLFAKKINIGILRNELTRQKKFALKLCKQFSSVKISTVKINSLKRQLKNLRGKLSNDSANSAKLNNTNLSLPDLNQVDDPKFLKVIKAHNHECFNSDSSLLEQGDSIDVEMIHM